MKVFHTIYTNNPVRYLQEIDDGSLAIVDYQGSIRLYELEEYRLVGGFKTNISQRDYSGNFNSISNDGKFAALSVKEQRRALVYSIKRKKIVVDMVKHKGDIEALAFDNLHRYMATGGQDGKIFLWSMRTGKVVYSLPPHADFISALSFNDSSTWLAVASFDRIITVTNLATMKRGQRLLGATSRAMALDFLPNHRLLSVDIDGGVVIWDYLKGGVIKRLSPMLEKISSSAISPDKRFLFLATILGNIGFYDLENFEKISGTFIKEKSEISALRYFQKSNQLVVGTIDGEIKFYSFKEDEIDLEKAIKNREYKLAYMKISENHMLLYSKAYKSLEKIWENHIEQARIFLESENEKSAQALFDPFVGVASKNRFAKKFITEYKQFKQFKEHIGKKKFPLAYQIANQNLSFKESREYRRLENRWRQQFRKAEQIIFEKGGDDVAREQLKLFRGVAEKSILIQKLFNERNIFIAFERMMARKDYKGVLNLVDKHPFLKALGEYEKLIDMFDNYYIASLKNFKKGNYSKVKQIASVLLHSPDYSREVSDMIDKADKYVIFHNRVSEGKIEQARRLIAEFPYLADTNIARELEADFFDAVAFAEALASKGDTKAVLATFEKYYKDSEKFIKIATILMRSYIIEMEVAIKKHNFIGVAKAVELYVKFFGIDEQITTLCEQYNTLIDKKFSSIQLDELQKGDISLWTPRMAIAPIVG